MKGRFTMGYDSTYYTDFDVRLNYDLNRFVNLTILFSAQVDANKLFEVILREAMMIGNCDAGTLYLLEGQSLKFKYLITKSQNVAINSKDAAAFPPVPLQETYASAYSAIKKTRLNIPDVYKDRKFDFNGSMKYDSMNGYHTGSMLVVPMAVGGDDTVGVLQLINAMDSRGKMRNGLGIHYAFTQEQEKLVMALGSVSALYIENRKLKGLM